MQTIIFILEIIGTLAFSISGTITGIKKNADIFGVTFLGITTAVGGGIIRDVLIGSTPPTIFTNYIFVVVACSISLLVFIFIFFTKTMIHFTNYKIDITIDIFDAIGLGIFTVNGMNTLLFSAEEYNAFLVIFVGLCTGIGGGMIRDVLVNDIPFVLHRRVYAVAAMIGGIAYYLLYMFTNLNYLISMTVGVLMVFTIRVIAVKCKWHLPKIKLK